VGRAVHAGDGTRRSGRGIRARTPSSRETASKPLSDGGMNSTGNRAKPIDMLTNAKPSPGRDPGRCWTHEELAEPTVWRDETGHRLARLTADGIAVRNLSRRDVGPPRIPAACGPPGTRGAALPCRRSRSGGLLVAFFWHGRSVSFGQAGTARTDIFSWSAWFGSMGDLMTGSGNSIISSWIGASARTGVPVRDLTLIPRPRRSRQPTRRGPLRVVGVILRMRPTRAGAPVRAVEDARPGLELPEYTRRR